MDAKGRIYCISGLGADEHIFRNLAVKNYELIPIPWVPFNPGDDLPAYAGKMSEHIPGASPVILGLSFGGMLAVEIGKMRKTEKTILVSSAKTPKELGLSRFTKVMADIVPVTILHHIDPFLNYYFGATTDTEKKLIKGYLTHCNPAFIRWCIDAMLSWKNEIIPPHLVHIHGTADRLIKTANVHADYWVEGGTHMMIYNKANEISNIISGILHPATEISQ